MAETEIATASNHIPYRSDATSISPELDAPRPMRKPALWLPGSPCQFGRSREDVAQKQRFILG